MVFLKGANLVGPENRDERGAYEKLDSRTQRYMMMEENEWKNTYEKMYSDRKYPGHDNLKLLVIPSIVYTGAASAFAFELYIKRAAFASSPLNFVKLGLVPVLTLLTMRNLDVTWDIIRYRNKYPEMYLP